MSKISIQPALYEALEQKFGEGEGRQWIMRKAAEAKLGGKPRVGAYVRELAYLEILPKNIMKGYELNLDKHDISYRIKGGHSTTATIPAALKYYLEQITDDNVSIFISKVANQFHEMKESSDTTFDISFYVRESIIYSIINDR
ncbi:hypothetical protein [Vibrio crassostreae]|uniref:hypothetical protein n=1 Tax=Vibrio crassostreae TaxID=246167 RepID=UPI001B316693|nr:hypothetical protein [Vibrio crassostreae]